MYLQKVISRKTLEKTFSWLASCQPLTKKSTIRIRKSVVWMRGSGSVPPGTEMSRIHNTAKMFFNNLWDKGSDLTYVHCTYTQSETSKANNLTCTIPDVGKEKCIKTIFLVQINANTLCLFSAKISCYRPVKNTIHSSAFEYGLTQ